MSSCPCYLEMVRLIPADHAGLILLMMPVGMILTAPIAGRISDVIGVRRPILAGFCLCVVATLLLATLSAGTRIGCVALYLLLLGVGTGVAFTPLGSAVMGEAPVRERGAASGLMRVMTNLGSTLGVAGACLRAHAEDRRLPGWRRTRSPPLNWRVRLTRPSGFAWRWKWRASCLRRRRRIPSCRTREKKTSS
jgi:MFS family permease